VVCFKDEGEWSSQNSVSHEAAWEGRIEGVFFIKSKVEAGKGPKEKKRLVFLAPNGEGRRGKG